MADIELVIKMPEEKYKWIKENNPKADKNSFVGIIVHGTPLPKGHGELVDIRPLMRGLYEEMCVGELTYTTSDVYRMIDEECPTIIEADKESEDKE